MENRILSVGEGNGRRTARRVAGQRGSALLLVLFLLLIATIFGMAILYSSDMNVKISKAYGERMQALASTDSAVAEVLWRLNLRPRDASPPWGSRVTVNELVDYDAFINPDSMGILVNGEDDDGDGVVDEPDELNLARDWSVLILLTPDEPNPGAPHEVIDGSIPTGPPWGSAFVEPTIQPQATWKAYTNDDVDSPEALIVRYKLDTDTALGDSEDDGAEIVFYEPKLVTNGVDDKNTLNALGGDGDPANDSPYNITWSDGTDTYPARGTPVLLVEAVARVNRGTRTVARRQVQAELVQPVVPANLKAVCGCSSTDMGSAQVTDSYRSSEGHYGEASTYEMGDVGSNADLICSGTILGSVEATGNITGADDVAHDATAGGSITGVPGEDAYPYFTPTPIPCDCFMDVDTMVAEAAADNDNPSSGYCQGPSITLTGNHTCTLDGGVYYYTDIKILGSAQITVGDVSSGPVIIYASGDLDLGGNGIVNAYRPEDLRIITSTRPPDMIVHHGTFDYNGIIYAPFAELRINGDPNIFGYVLADVVNCVGNPQVHFDEDLNKTFKHPGRFRSVAWHEVRS